MNSLFPTSYSQDFEDSWKAFHPSKNDAKSTAYAAWQKTSKRRLSVGAFGKRIIFCIEAYVTWLDAENDRRRRQRQSDCPKCHFATWINQARYDSFMDDADARTAALEAEAINAAPLFKGWEAQAESLVKEMQRGPVETWFKGVNVDLTGNPQIEFPSAFKAHYVAKNFPFAVIRAFGNCTLTVAGHPKEKFEL